MQMLEWEEGVHDYFIIMELPNSTVDLSDLIHKYKSIPETCERHIFQKVSSVNSTVENHFKIICLLAVLLRSVQCFKHIEHERYNVYVRHAKVVKWYRTTQSLHLVKRRVPKA